MWHRLNGREREARDLLVRLVGGEGSANYLLAARFAPYRIEDMIHATTVEPQWIEGTEATTWCVQNPSLWRIFGTLWIYIVIRCL